MVYPMGMNNTAPTATITLDLFGESRTVELNGAFNGKPHHVAFVNGFVGTIGGGSARYPTSLTLWRVTEEKPANRCNSVVTASDGSRWHYNMTCAIRNRNNARIVGWADVAGTTNSWDQTRNEARDSAGG